MQENLRSVSKWGVLHLISNSSPDIIGIPPLIGVAVILYVDFRPSRAEEQSIDEVTTGVSLSTGTSLTTRSTMPINPEKFAPRCRRLRRRRDTSPTPLPPLIGTYAGARSIASLVGVRVFDHLEAKSIA